MAIPLHDAIRTEIERVQSLDSLSPQPSDPGHTQLAVLAEVLGASERLIALVATAAYWGDPAIDRWWTGDIVRMARRPLLSSSLAVIDRPRVPALFMSWAGGMAAVAAGRDDLLATLFSLERVPEPGRNELIPAVLAASPELLHAGDNLARMYRMYRPVFVDLLSLGRDSFTEAWERWQYLLLLAAWDLRERENTSVHLRSLASALRGTSRWCPFRTGGRSLKRSGWVRTTRWCVLGYSAASKRG